MRRKTPKRNDLTLDQKVIDDLEASKDYLFSPLDYGFRKVKSPLTELLVKNSYFKVTARCDQTPSVVWYLWCSKRVSSDKTDPRWIFYASLVDLENVHQTWSGSVRPRWDQGHEVYCGPITTHTYAQYLLLNLMGTCLQSGVLDHGVYRYLTDL